MVSRTKGQVRETKFRKLQPVPRNRECCSKTVSRDTKNNAIVIMCINSEFSIKRFNKQGEKFFPTLDSFNPVFKPLYPSEGQDWAVVGVVTYSIKKL